MNVLLATDSAVLRHSVSRALLDRGHDVRGSTQAAIARGRIGLHESSRGRRPRS